MARKEEKSKIKSDILLRVRLLYLLFAVVGVVVFARLIWVQLFSSEIAYNANRLASRIFRTDTLPAQRGSILARNGEPLAVSMFRYQVEMDFGSEGLDSVRTFREQSDSLAKLLSAFFGDRTPAQYRDFLRTSHARHYRLVNGRDTTHLRATGFLTRIINRLRGEEYVTRRIYDTIRDHKPVKLFPREVDYNEWQELRKYPILNWNMGMVYNVVRHDRRIYPQGELARRTIGLIGDRGNYGIEAVWREELAGRDGHAVRQRIARGFSGRVIGSGEDPVDGLDVVSTLDLDLQDVADKALRERLESQNAIWGTTIVMEVQTGEILALVNLGRNSRGEFVENTNYAIASRAELGSVFKLATMIALLEDAGMPLSTVYDTGNGRPVVVGGARVQDSHAGFHDMDFRTAVAQSSNVYFAEAVYERYADRKEAYSDFLRTLHLDRTVGLEAYGERSPYFPSDWKRIGGANQALARLAFGYVIELTPMQMITLYNAVANDGRMVAPHLVRELRRGDVLERRIRPEVLEEQICSQSTLRKVQDLLVEVCRSGTAAPYFHDTTRYRAAAKTGTAQFAQNGIRYSDGYYMGSMVAYFPAEKPRYTILTTIHTRRGGGKAYYGGPLAGPVVKRMADYIYNREQEWHATLDVPHDAPYADPQRPQRIKGGDIAAVRKVADVLDARSVSYESRTGWGRARVDSASRVEITTVAEDPSLVPDVRGMGLKDALFLMESRGLRVSFSGTGAVQQQSLAPGTRAVHGAAVHLTLR